MTCLGQDRRRAHRDACSRIKIAGTATGCLVATVVGQAKSVGTKVRDVRVHHSVIVMTILVPNQLFERGKLIMA